MPEMLLADRVQQMLEIGRYRIGHPAVVNVFGVTQGMEHLLDAEGIVSRTFISYVAACLMREVVFLKEIAIVLFIEQVDG